MAAVVAAAFLLPLALLTVAAVTRPGRLVGVLALLGVAAAVGGLTPLKASRPWRLGLAGLALATAALLVGEARRPIPAPRERDFGLRAFVAGRPGPVWAARLGALPEVDLVALGSQVAGRVVPWVRSDHRRRIRERVPALYREVEADPEGHALAPVFHLAAAELLGLEFDAGHYYAYLPRPRTGRRPGAVVFLHGNAGNFKLLPWAWRRLAEDRNLAILCPTFGYGLWNEGGVEAVGRARADAVERLDLDPTRIYLAGLSDGGKGVTRSGMAHPLAYRGLIYLSPTMLADELGSEAFRAGWSGRPIFVATGGRDWNVRPETVTPAVDLLRASGCDVTFVFDPDEDHFYFFGQLDALLGRIGSWMDAVEAPRTDEPRPRAS